LLAVAVSVKAQKYGKERFEKLMVTQMENRQ
jgi:hypothetical protein